MPIMRFPRICLSAALLVPLLAAAADTSSRIITVGLQPADGVNTVGTRSWLARYPQEDGAAPIALEAEDASFLALQIGSDTNASGGRYVAAPVGKAEYVFYTAAAAPRVYYQWARINVPIKGHFNHQESMDGGDILPHTDTSAESPTPNTWVWIRALEYTLGSGKHTLTLHNWNGSIKLDKIIFTPDPNFKPEGIGPASTRFTGPQTGMVTSRVYRPAGLVGWGAFHADYAPAGGRILVEASTDGGKQFKTTLADGDLRDFPATPAGIRFRITLTAGPAGSGPAIENPQIGYTMKPVDGSAVTIENEAVALTVHPDAGAISRLVWKTRNMAVGREGTNDTLFALTVGHPMTTDTVELTSRDFDLAGVRKTAPDALSVHYTSAAYALEVTCTFTLHGSQAYCGMEIVNNDTVDVAQIRYPRVRGIAMGKSGADDLITTPAGFVHTITQPGDVLKGLDDATATWWHVVKFGKARSPMGFLDVTDPEGGGIYVGTHDPEWHDTDLIPNKGAGESADIEILTYRRVAPNSKVVLPPCVIAFHDGDWHAGVDIYRAWARTAMHPPLKNPDWLDCWDGWLGNWAVPSDASGSWMSVLNAARKAEKNGLNYVQNWNNNANPSGYDGFNYINPHMGRLAVLRQANERAHQLGVLVTYYINLITFALPDSKTGSIFQFLPGQYPEWMMKPDRAWYERNAVSTMGGVHFNYQCPGATERRADLKHFSLDVYTRRGGGDGIYFDQAAAAAPSHCVDLRHGHGYGQETLDTTTLFQDIITSARTFNPNFTTSMEGSSVPISQAVTMHLLSGLHINTEPRILRYAFPELILLEGLCNGGRSSDLLSMGYAWLHGSRFDYWGGSDLGERLIALRRTLNPHLYRGRYTDTVGVIGEEDGKLLVRRFVRDDGGNRLVCATVWNIGGKAAGTFKIDAALCGPHPTVWLITGPDAWQKLDIAPDERGWVTIPAPKEEFSQVAIAGVAEPAAQIHNVPGVAGGQGQLIVDLRALMPGKHRLTAKLEPPKGFSAPKTTLTLDGAGTLTMPISFPRKAAAGIHNATLCLAMDKLRWTLPVRLVVRDPVWADVAPLDDTHFRMTLTNNTTRVLPVTITAAGGADEGKFYPPTRLAAPMAPVTLNVPANGSASADLTITFADPPGDFRYLDFTLTYPGGKQRFLHDQAPMLWDPEFEQDRNGDGILDYWAQGPGMIDYTDPKSGKACMRIDPMPDGSKRILIGSRTGPRLWLAGHRYRLRAYVKRGGADVVPANSMNAIWTPGGSCELKPVGPLDNVNKWQLYETEVTAQPNMYVIPHLFHNGGKSPWWIDSFTIEDLGPAKTE